MELSGQPEDPLAAAPEEDATDTRFSFAKFAAHPFFKDVNAWLVARAGIQPGTDVVDLGCGPGAVTELILQRMGRPPLGHVYAIDPSASNTSAFGNFSRNCGAPRANRPTITTMLS